MAGVPLVWACGLSNPKLVRRSMTYPYSRRDKEHEQARLIDKWQSCQPIRYVSYASLLRVQGPLYNRWRSRLTKAEKETTHMASARKHFTERIDGSNFMSPEVVEHGWVRKGSLSYELSRGEGILKDTHIYGVTLSKQFGDLSRAWPGLEQAQQYVAYLQARLGRDSG